MTTAPQLSAWCDRIEAVLAADCACRVVGGVVRGDAVRLVLRPAPGVRYVTVRRQRAALAEALGVPVVLARIPGVGVALTVGDWAPVVAWVEVRSRWAMPGPTEGER